MTKNCVHLNLLFTKLLSILFSSSSISLHPEKMYPLTADKSKENGNSPRVKRLRTNNYLNQTDDVTAQIHQSQPTPQLDTTDSSNDNNTTILDSNTESSRGGDFCFSQPTLMDDLILCTQLNSTQGQSQNAFHRLVKRMTRFFVTTNYDETIKRLSNIVKDLGFNWKINDTSIVSSILCYAKSNAILNYFFFIINSTDDNIND